MATSPRTRALNPVWLGVAVAVVILAILGFFYLSTPTVNRASGPTAEALAYLPNLHISDVKMNAAENLVQQQVVYVDGKLENRGTRPLEEVDVFCVFSGVDGKEIYRERTPILAASGRPLAPGQSRAFRLPFDNLPDGWNQALPRLEIAQIRFAG